MSEPPREKTDNPEDPVLFASSLHLLKCLTANSSCVHSTEGCDPLTQIRSHSMQENGNGGTWKKRAPSQSSRSCHLQMMWLFLSVLSGREPAEDEKRMPEKADIKKARGKNSRGGAVLGFPQNEWKRTKSLSFSLSLTHTPHTVNGPSVSTWDYWRRVTVWLCHGY